MRIVIMMSFACLCYFHSLAQNNAEDSLERELNRHTTEDTVRIGLLQALCKKTTDASKAHKAADEIISIAKKLQLPNKEASGFLLKANTFLNEGKDSVYLSTLEQAAILYELATDKKGTAIVLRSRGRYFENNNEYNRALENYTKAFEKASQLQEGALLSYIYSDMGNCYYKMGIYNKSIEYHLLSQKGAEQSNDLQIQAIAINNIAMVNKAIKKYSTAIDQYKKAMQVYAAVDDSMGYAKAIQGIGIVYDLQLKGDSALYYYQEALGINLRNNFKLSIAENYNNIGIIYNDKNLYSQAYAYFNKAINAFKELDNEYNVKQVEVNIGELLYNAPDSFFSANNISQAKKYNMALEIFNGIVAYAKETEDLSTQAKGWEGLSNTHEKKGDYKNALAALQKKQALQDSLVNEELVEETTRQTDKFEFEKREAITLAKHSAALQQERTIKKSIAALATLLLLSIIIYFILYKRKRDAVARQKEAELKTEISETEMKALRSQMNPHFIFNSLNSISDFIAKNDVQEADRYLTKFAKLMRIILENSEQKDVPIADDLKALELYMQLEALRMNNKFSYQIKVDDDIDKEATLIPPLILQPFVENSIWHGIAQKEGAGKISIHIKKENENMINCIVEDDGIGRKQSAEIKRAIPKQAKTSLGMKITQSRIDILNKIKNSHAAIKLSDLEPGVRVEVRLPLTTGY